MLIKYQNKYNFHINSMARLIIYKITVKGDNYTDKLNKTMYSCINVTIFNLVIKYEGKITFFVNKYNFNLIMFIKNILIVSKLIHKKMTIKMGPSR